MEGEGREGLDVFGDYSDIQAVAMDWDTLWMAG